MDRLNCSLRLRVRKVNLAGGEIRYNRVLSSFDPLVVPTLVDNLKKRVIVDSLNIMKYIDQVSLASSCVT